jgi:HAD superfamily hydrolase (TIGR01509 family)
MIKLIVFDLDGVLVETKQLHYDALNKALSDVDVKYVISFEEHLSKYDGLSTRKKLDLLSKEKGLSGIEHNGVWLRKQNYTSQMIRELKPDNRIINILERLKNDGYKIAVASNSIRETVKITLLKLGFLEHIDFYLSNEDVKYPKPSPELYLKSMIEAGVSPKETLIIEDSIIGRTAANESGAYLMGINNPDDVIYDNIINYINSINRNYKKPKWQGGKMNVLIPMAGAGSRFEKAGYTFPKPLIDVRGKPMIQWVVDNLNVEAKYIFIVQKSHFEKYNLKDTLNNFCPNNEIVQVDGITEGAACTTLLAKQYIDKDEPLIIANSDQFVEWNSEEFIYSCSTADLDANILTFKSTHPKWSYTKLNELGYVTEVAEKKPISDIATVGIYYWRKGSDYVKYAEQMISKNIRVNNEFYVCPVFNEAIEDGKKIRTFNIEKMWGLGTPEDLENFLKNYNEDNRSSWKS